MFNDYGFRTVTPSGAMRTMSRAILEQLGYEATIVASGTEAVEAYKSSLDQATPFDAVVLDLTVQGEMGGREAIRQLRELDPTAKAVVISGYSNDAVLASPKRFGFDEAVSKPFTVQQLGQAPAQCPSTLSL